MTPAALRCPPAPRGARMVTVRAGVYVAVASAPAMLSTPPAAVDVSTALGLPDWRAREQLAARALLRRLLTEVVGARAAALPLAAKPGGRPYLPDRADLSVSLSHSGDLVAAALGVGRAVGVDVQRPEPVPPELIDRCCSPGTARVLAALPAGRRAERFAGIWTVQEACVKATGAGLAGQPWRIPVGLTRSAGRWRGLRWLKVGCRLGVPVGCAYQIEVRR